jgi:kumamolisin
MAKLRTAQLNPRSPQFRQWLTPQQFGEHFGQSAERYAAFVAYLRAAGLKVTEAPSRAFLVADGSAAQVERLLSIRFEPIEGEPASVHTFTEQPKFPTPFADMVLNVSGLDTRIVFKHHIHAGANLDVMGPQDLRAFYNANPLLTAGWLGQQQKTVVLSTATGPSDPIAVDAIHFFLRSVSDVQTPFLQDVLPNPGNDFDGQPGASQEFDLDVEMQSVGNVAGDSITLLVSPASTVFSVGANAIANNHADATSVSISLGNCEPAAQQQVGLITALRNAVIQGTMEGQTWFAASGDNGAKDCQFGGTTGPAVDFPSDIPEMMAAGGSEVKAMQWDTNHAVTAYQQEVAWNDGAQGGAAGGGLSVLFPVPAYQQGLIPDGGRSVPDIAMMAGLPGVAIMGSIPPGPLEGPTLGTSVASPLSAGLFALIASRVGCRLGDVHAALYAIGLAQDGGAGAFHDITSGNLTFGGVTGPSAGPGFDSASGWGSIDVKALAEAFPPCPALPDGGTVAPIDAGVPYDQCAFVCDGGTPCTTIPEGPSTCAPVCDPTDAGSCGPATVCNAKTVYSQGSAGGLCVAGCKNDNDCTGGTVCAACSSVCIAPGSAGARIGDACSTNAQCPTGASCQTNMFLPGGYCTEICEPGMMTGGCACPSGSACQTIAKQFMPTSLCFFECHAQADCARNGYACQPEANGHSVCLPKCQILSFGGQMVDTCLLYDTTKACDTVSGVCGGIDAGTGGGAGGGGGTGGGAGGGSAGGGSAGGGTDQTVTLPTSPSPLGPSYNNGCGCASADLSPLLFGLLALLRRRRV